MGVSEQNPSEQTRDNRKRDGVSVLDAMLVTAAVFHFERSALNAAAEENAVGDVDTVRMRHPKK
jgi:hypothetical protein